MKKIILLLGGGNDEDGNLNRMSMDRIECALSIYHHNKNMSILCTGGFGEHFNKTPYPHASYVQQYLTDKGVHKDHFLSPVISSNTIEDFRLAKSIIDTYTPDLLIVLTSDFHMERVKVLYELIIHYSPTLFVAAPSSLPKEELNARIVHEKQALQLLKDNQYRLY